MMMRLRLRTRARSPTGLQFMSRAGPPGGSNSSSTASGTGMAYSYDAELLKTVDVEFLFNVRTASNAMTAHDPSLARVEPKLTDSNVA